QPRGLRRGLGDPWASARASSTLIRARAGRQWTGAVAFLRSGRRSQSGRWPSAMDRTTGNHLPERPRDLNPTTPEILRRRGLARGAVALDWMGQPKIRI